LGSPPAPGLATPDLYRVGKIHPKIAGKPAIWIHMVRKDMKGQQKGQNIRIRPDSALIFPTFNILQHPSTSFNILQHP
jgi:hypothetical protein